MAAVSTRTRSKKSANRIRITTDLDYLIFIRNHSDELQAEHGFRFCSDEEAEREAESDSPSTSEEESDSESDDVICLGDPDEDEEEMEAIVISSDDDYDDDRIEADGSKHSDPIIDDVKEEPKSESDDEDRKVEVVSDSEDDFLSSSTESQEDEDDTSDEEFQADDDLCVRLSSDDDSSSYCDEHDEDEKEKVRLRFEKMEKNVERESGGVCRKNAERNEKQETEEEEVFENTVPLSVKINECSVEIHEELKETDRAGVATIELEMLNSYSEERVKKAEKPQETKGLKRKFENVNGDQHKRSRDKEEPKIKKEQGNFNAKPVVSPSVENQVKKSDSLEPEPKVKDAIKKELKNNDGVEVDGNNGEVKVGMDDETMKDLRRVLRMPPRTKDRHLIKLLAEFFYDQGDSKKDDLKGLEDLDDGFHDNDTRPRVLVEVFPSRWSFAKDEEPVEKTEAEKELDMLWDEMARLLRFGDIESQVGNIGSSKVNQSKGSSASACEHDFWLDEEIGIYCRLCRWIVTDIKDVTPPFVDKLAGEGSSKRVSSDGVGGLQFDEVQLDGSGDHESACHHNKGTVWSLIPDIKQSLYPHQQEGFEFIWENMAGTVDLNALKSVDPRRAGGCIISHAPGTGKTRLTMVFLQTYLQIFPKCLPVLIAPANLLLNWEEEFKKWDIGVPFYNLNNPELSGKENSDAMGIIEWSKNSRQRMNAIRMVKLYSWLRQKSILGISYSLYENLVGEESKLEVGNKRNRNMKKEKKRTVQKENIGGKVMGDILRDKPGLLVLDEGHTPRNQRSLIWKILSQIQAQKRIILSGTPFQNNFLELYNILCLVKPSFPDSIPQELKKFCQKTIRQWKKASKDLDLEAAQSENLTDERINQLKLLMDPFVHVQKGSILQKKLPGVKDCVLTLSPDNLQKKILESIDSSQNSLQFEHKLALTSVHPSLFLACKPSEKEESVINSVINKDQLEALKLDPNEGVKTKFLMEFVRLCDAANEKVLVFSQFIGTLRLIMDQLKSSFNWSKGKEVLYMCGSMDHKQKQMLIHGFNDENRQTKILLASIKACSEGINLVGASRVVLMDVVWNPSVERQAISRAYRLGQTKVVYTYHLLTEGTNECAKFSKQVEKDKLSELVFSARSNESGNPKSSAVSFEDEILDQMVCHEKLKDMFAYVQLR